MTFPRAITFVLSHEGGYTSGSDGDPGGETKWGISKRSHPNEDIKNLTVERAKEIYLEEYWKPIADTLPFPCDVVAFDAAVNQGMSFAKSMVFECGKDEIAMLFYRLKKYSAIVAGRPASLKYLRGWVNRIVQLYDTIKE
jgi:hypothetical protein